MSNYIKCLHEITTHGIYLTDGLKADDIQKLEELNNLNVIVFELNGDKREIQPCVSKNMNKAVS